MDGFQLVLHRDVLYILHKDVNVVEQVVRDLDVLKAIVATTVSHLHIEFLDVFSKRISFGAFAFWGANW